MNRANYLYEIVNSVNSKKYIGITNNPKTRLQAHLKTYSGCPKLRRAVSKYGSDKFSMNVLCVGTREYVINLERLAIEAYDSIANGYNVLPADPSLKEFVSEAIYRPLRRHIEANGAHNRGYHMNTDRDNVPHYVSGFWFNSAGEASKILNMKRDTIHKRRSNGTLGDTFIPRVDSRLNSPVYVGGFWFSNLKVASKSLSRSESSLYNRVRRGSVEQKTRRDVSGKMNPMSGKTGSCHPNSRPVSVDGVIFPSIACAVIGSKYTKKMLGTRLKSGSNKNIFYLQSPIKSQS